jgi:hypothetical protein
MSNTTATRTNKLAIGDTVRFGNILDGFTHATIVAVENIEGRPHSRKVHMRFSHGGVGAQVYGVGSIWDVLNVGAAK